MGDFGQNVERVPTSQSGVPFAPGETRTGTTDTTSQSCEQGYGQTASDHTQASALDQSVAAMPTSMQGGNMTVDNTAQTGSNDTKKKTKVAPIVKELLEFAHKHPDYR